MNYIEERILFNDICRCHDEQWEPRHRCLRWIQRDQYHCGDGSEPSYTSHATTLKPGWIPHTMICDDFIHARTTTDALASMGKAGQLVAAWIEGDISRITPKRCPSCKYHCDVHGERHCAESFDTAV